MTQLTDATTTEAPAELTVCYELTKDDVVETLLYIQGKSASIRKQRLRGILITVIFGAYIGLMLMIVAGAQYTGEIIIWLSCFLVAFLILFRRQRRTQMNNLIEPEGFESTLVPTTMTLSPEGLTLEDDFQYARLKWLAITQVKSEKDYLFFYLNPLTAHAVPKRAFNSPQDAEAFYAFARRYCPQHSHCPKCKYSLRGCHRSLENQPVKVESKPASEGGFLIPHCSWSSQGFLFFVSGFSGLAFPGFSRFPLGGSDAFLCRKR